MGSSIEVVLTLGFDHHSKKEQLHDYVAAPAFNGQRLDQICGNDTHSYGLAGSGQAGAILVYAGLLRNITAIDVVDYLRNAPWDGIEGVVVIHNENYDPVIDRCSKTGDERIPLDDLFQNLRW